MKHQWSNKKNLDCTTIQNSLNTSLKAQDSPHIIQKQEQIRQIILLQQPLIINQKEDNNKAGIYLTLKFLIRVLQSISPPNDSLDKSTGKYLLSKINAKLQNFQDKFGFTAHRLTFYIILQIENKLTVELKNSYLNFFRKQSYSIYRIDKLFWKKTIILTCQLQFSKNTITFEQLNSQQFRDLQENIRKQELQMQKRDIKNRQIQIREQQKEGMILNQSLTKAVSFIDQFQRKHPNFNLNFKKKPYQKIKFKNPPTIKIYMLLEINFDTFKLIQQCQTYQSPFMVFLIPYAYLIAQTLTYYQQKSRQAMSLNFLFHQLIKKINYIKNTKNPQLDPAQITDHVTYLVNTNKYSPEQISQKQGNFLQCHSERMKSFIPVYFDIFSFHAFEKYNFVDSLSHEQNIKIKRQKLKQRIQQMHQDYQKYNNEDL